MKNIYRSVILLCLFAASKVSLAQIPIYNSYPSAQATIFLDFDGHFVNGTSWNSNGPISCGPANLTNDQIIEVFNRVAEDYRPFNINITTDSTRYWSAPAYKRMRIVLTVTSEWYGAAGGVSFVGSFNWGDNTPGFVFTALLGYNQKRVAEAASHEAGHTLGLKHQSSYNSSCVKTAEYNPGNGEGEIGWAPIMGVGYYRNMTLWNNGTDPYGCNSRQDDLGIITSAFNGFGYRTDDHAGNADATATGTSFVNNQFNIQGVIERMSDKDVFRFDLQQAGNIHLDAAPYNIGTGNSGSNLDMQVELMNSAGVVTSNYNPGDLLGLTIDTFLAAGTYYLSVQGKGNAYAPEYASLGSYSINSSFIPVAPLPLRKLELSGTLQNSNHQLNWIIDADEQVTVQKLEVSSDGRNYSTLASLARDRREYRYVPAAYGEVHYRMNVSFDNGKQYYSNVVTLRGSIVGSGPKLMGNPVTSSMTVSSPAAFSYTITDFSGRSISHGSLQQGLSTIATGKLASGMYIIRFSNGTEQFNEKFMKQ